MGIKNRNPCPIFTKVYIKHGEHIYIHNPEAQIDQKIIGFPAAYIPLELKVGTHNVNCNN